MLRSFFIVLFVCLVGSLFGQDNWLQMPVPPDTSVIHATLPNGLTYYIKTNTEPQHRAELRLVVKAGSLHEDEDQLGIAHFVEHMAFNGTRNFAKNELIHFLERSGARFGADLNAYTSFDRTVYKLQLRSDSVEMLEKGLLILEDWATGIQFDPAEINRERGVVIAEWRSRLSASQRLQNQYYPKLLAGSRYAQRLPIGSPAIIDTASYSTIRRFYEKWYRPDRMAVVAVGDFDPLWMEKEIRRRFGSLPNPSEKVKHVRDSLPIIERRAHFVGTDPEASFANLQLINKLPQQLDSSWQRARQQMIRSLYNRMLNERFYELVQQADPPFSFASIGWGGFLGGADAYTFSVTTRAEQLSAALRTVLYETNRIREHGFTRTELTRAKEKQWQSISQAYRERDKRPSANVADQLVGQFFAKTNQPSLERYYERLPDLLVSIRLEDVQQVAHHGLQNKDQFLLLTAARADSAALPSTEFLWSVVDHTLREKTEPYVDAVPQQPLGADLSLSPVSAVLLQRDSVLQIEQYRLANGIELWLKPTDFKNDEILMSSHSPGGHSLVSDEDFVHVDHMMSVLSLSGVDQMSGPALEKLMAGKQISVSPSLQAYYEGLSGRTSVQDMELFFKLLYLQATRPRWDTTAFRAYIKRNEDMMQNVMENPNYQFAKFRTNLLYQQHPRRQFDPIGDIQRLDLDKMQAIYADRFADFSDYTFTFVGNFAKDSLLHLAQLYLGNLPVSGRTEKERDEGIRLPNTPIDTSYVGALTPKARVELIWHGPATYTSLNRYHYLSMRQLLDIRLREEMREAQAEVYGVRVNAVFADKPLPNYRFSVSFQCRPAAVDTLIQTVQEEITKIAAGHISQDNVQKIQASQRKRLEEARRTNAYWITALSKLQKESQDLEELYPGYRQQIYDGLRAEDLQKAAATYLQSARYVFLRYLPED